MQIKATKEVILSAGNGPELRRQLSSRVLTYTYNAQGPLAPRRF